MPRTALWWLSRISSTRCSDDLRCSVPESAWLTSSRDDRRRASRAALSAGRFGGRIARGTGRLLQEWEDVACIPTLLSTFGASASPRRDSPAAPRARRLRFCSLIATILPYCHHVKSRPPRTISEKRPKNARARAAGLARARIASCSATPHAETHPPPHRR